MGKYIRNRFIFLLILMMLMSLVSFMIIQLPPGDFVSLYVSTLEQEMGTVFTEEEIANIRTQYGLHRSPLEQYYLWIKNILIRGDFGRSLEWGRPVVDLLAERMPVTVLLSLLTLVFTYLIAIPLGIYAARHQYSITDYTFSMLGFFGLSIPNFLFALVLLYISHQHFGVLLGGLFSAEYENAPWSLAKLGDLLLHLLLPIVVIGTANLAGIFRVLRATLLDELKRPYVVAARARGLGVHELTYKYPVRVALNPIISTIGYILPAIVSGATVTAIVLSIPSIGSLLYRALLSQDMFLAGACVLMLTFLTALGTFISDILLVVVDPRIRLTTSR